MKGNLYLIPNTLGNPDHSLTIPGAIIALVQKIDVYIVEELRSARRFLKSLDQGVDIDRLTFHLLNEHTPVEEVPALLEETLKGAHTAVISEAGVPGVADPGAAVVSMAHELGIRVIPLTGPSSILLSLMASGLNGQNFSFLGYLPVRRQERIRKIREISDHAVRSGETQIFIETPYRNDALLEDLLNQSDPRLRLCIASELTLETEVIQTRSIGQWRSTIPDLHKKPVVFLLGR